MKEEKYNKTITMKAILRKVLILLMVMMTLSAITLASNGAERSAKPKTSVRSETINTQYKANQVIGTKEEASQPVTYGKPKKQAVKTWEKESKKEIIKAFQGSQEQLSESKEVLSRWLKVLVTNNKEVLINSKENAKSTYQIISKDLMTLEATYKELKGKEAKEPKEPKEAKEPKEPNTNQDGIKTEEAIITLDPCYTQLLTSKPRIKETTTSSDDDDNNNLKAVAMSVVFSAVKKQKRWMVKKTTLH